MPRLTPEAGAFKQVVAKTTFNQFIADAGTL